MTTKPKVTFDPEYRISIALENLRYAKKQLQEAIRSGMYSTEGWLLLADAAVGEALDAVAGVLPETKSIPRSRR